MSIALSPQPHVEDLARRAAEFVRETVVPEEGRHDDVAAAGSLTLRACWELDQGRSGAQTTSIAQAFTAEAAWRVVDRSLQIRGSLGVSGDLPLNRFLREVRPFRIHDGPSETHNWTIARRVLRANATRSRG